MARLFMERVAIFLSIVILFSTPNVFAQVICLDCDENKPDLEFSYKISYDKTYCTGDYRGCIYNSNKLPVEGQNIVYWPNISIWFLPEINKTENLILYYYLVDPSGKLHDGPPMFIDNARIVNGESIISTNAVGGISIPSDYPGFWEIKSILLSNEEYFSNLNYSSPSIDLRDRYDETFFNSERVHILSYSEYVSEKIAKGSLFVSVLALLIALVAGFIPLYRDKKRQVSLLESLYSELDAISSEKKEMRMLGEKISTEGNLQWVKGLFEPGLKPAHSIWKLNTQIYVEGLNRKIKFKKTRDLKKVLILITQKIELIENYMVQYDKIPKNSPKHHKESIKEAIVNVFNEVIGLIDTTKKYLEKEFGIGDK